MNAKEIAKIRKSANKQLVHLPTFNDEIPLTAIREILAQHDLKLTQEDGTDYSGIFCGADGAANINVWGSTVPMMKVHFVLRLEWHTMQSGRIEINTYLP